MEKKETSLKLNFIMNAILKMTSFVFPLITFPYVSRILLPEGIGKVSFAISLISYFSMFAQLGIPTYGIRACAKVRNNKEELSRTAHELLAINLIMSIFSYAALALALVFVPRLQEDRLLYMIVSITIFLTSIGMEWLYQALEQYSYITIRSIIFKIIALVAMFVLVHEKSDYIIYGGISVFASSASYIFNFINLHKYIDLKPVGNYNLKRHLKPVGIFFAMSCATTIYTNLDTVMLGFMTSDIEVGYYNVAVRIKTLLVSIVTSLGTVLLPRASYCIEQGYMEEFRKISKKALNFIFVVATPIMLYFIFFAKEGVYLLSGESYTQSIVPMQLIMPTLLFIGISNIWGMQILVPLGKENIVLYSEIAGAIVDIIINVNLIPCYASAGAAIGTTIAELVVLFVQYIALRNEMKDLFKVNHYGKWIVALILGSAVAFWVKLLNFGSLVTLLISAVLFFGIYFLFLFITKEELVVDVVNQVLGKIKK